MTSNPSFFSRAFAVLRRKAKKNLVESFCVWFLSARDYSRWKNPMNFVFTSLSFLASVLVFVFLLYFFFLTRYKNKLFAVEWKWQTFFSVFFFLLFTPPKACQGEVFWQEVLRLTRPGKKFANFFRRREKGKQIFTDSLSHNLLRRIPSREFWITTENFRQSFFFGYLGKVEVKSKVLRCRQKFHASFCEGESC